VRQLARNVQQRPALAWKKFVFQGSKTKLVELQKLLPYNPAGAWIVAPAIGAITGAWLVKLLPPSGICAPRLARAGEKAGSRGRLRWIVPSERSSCAWSR